ncbi:MAG: three-Cys-motif partner protein TcmP [Lysobacterales bacterium]|nr:three-Cys-motif partner protein TcmP [Xanthomonadales bacterium]
MSKAQYEDDEDGRKRAIVGEWAEDKIQRLVYYINISKAARRKFRSRAYAELFCGPGRCRIKHTTRVIDGTAIAAYKESVRGGVPFDAVFIADAKEEYSSACGNRLIEAGAKGAWYSGNADVTVDDVCKQMRQYSFGLCLLDPFALRPLPFSVVEKLLALPRVDLIVHVSYFDMQRNMTDYVNRNDSPLDEFAPGWRQAVDLRLEPSLLVIDVVRYWMSLVAARSSKWCSEDVSLIRGPNRAPIYWLFMISGHEKAHELWRKVYPVGPYRDLFQGS